MSVENPRKIKGFATAVLLRSKTDKQDAKLIAQYCKAVSPEPWRKPTPEQTRLKELTQYLGRLKRQKASEQTKKQTAPDYLAVHLQSTIDHLAAQIKFVQKLIQDFFRQNPQYRQQKERLQTIDGVGDNAANSLLAVLSRNQRFKSAAQFVAYLGLDPKIRQSGTSVNGKAGISKVGNTQLRTALFIPAMHAYRSETFRSFTNRLKANGKRPKQIIVALMRKLAIIAYHLIKTGKDFEPERYTG